MAEDTEYEDPHSSTAKEIRAIAERLEDLFEMVETQTSFKVLLRAIPMGLALYIANAYATSQEAKFTDEEAQKTTDYVVTELKHYMDQGLSRVLDLKRDVKFTDGGTVSLT